MADEDLAIEIMKNVPDQVLEDIVEVADRLVVMQNQAESDSGIHHGTKRAKTGSG